MMIRPIFGGLFVSYGTWRGVFFVNVPIGVAIFVLLVLARPMVAHIPEYHGTWQPDHCSARARALRDAGGFPANKDARGMYFLP